MRSTGGLVLFLFGFWWVAMILGFASMIDPSQSADQWWRAYWDRIIWGGGLIEASPGVIALGVGGYLMLSSEHRRPRPTKTP